MPTVTNNEHLKRGCGQCDMCAKCKRKMLEEEEKEHKKLKSSEKTCVKCGLSIKCEDCIACPKCKHQYGKSISTISVDKSKSTLSPGSDISSIKAQVGSEEAGNALVTTDPQKLAMVQKTDYDIEAEHMANWYPPHIDPKKHPLIPIPHPPVRVELRGGRLMPMCLCLKRNGLQSDCPQTGCQGNPQCMRYLVPACIPSGFTLADPKVPYLQKADEPECYSKAELLKLQAPGAGPTCDAAEPKPSTPSEDDKDKQMVVSELKVVRLIPNEPPNYISEPPVDDYKAPCRRHGKYGVPGSGKYTKFPRCRLRDGKTLPKSIVPAKIRT